jgi:hypothetical protein
VGDDLAKPSSHGPYFVNTQSEPAPPVHHPLDGCCEFIVDEPQLESIDLDSPFCKKYSFFSILWCSETGDHSQEDLAKFGYGTGTKIKKFKNPSQFWLQARAPIVKSDIFIKNLLKSGY